MRPPRQERRGRSVKPRKRSKRERAYALTVAEEKTHTDKICRLLGIHHGHNVSVLPYLAKHRWEVRDYYADC